MPGLRFCKLLFPNSHAHCLPIRFCQWSVLMADWKEEGTSGCQLLSTASPPSSSLQLLSVFPAHHQIPRGTNTHWSHLSWWSDLRLSSTPSATWAGAVWSASTKRSKSQPAWELSFTLPVLVTPLLSFCSPSPAVATACSYQYQALGAQEAMTNIWVTLLSPLSSNIHVPNSLYWICSIGDT